MIGGRLVTVQMTVAAASDEVWRALREPAEIARWFGWDCDGLEAEIERIFVSGAQEADDPRRLETGDGTFELEPVPGEPDHTAVRVNRAEPSGEAGADAARVPWGDELTGETYFSTDRQLGLTVDDWGDGLLVLGRWRRRRRRHLTTFGLDDDGFESLERPWKAAWEAGRSVAP